MSRTPPLSRGETEARRGQGAGGFCEDRVSSFPPPSEPGCFIHPFIYPPTHPPSLPANPCEGTMVRASLRRVLSCGASGLSLEVGRGGRVFPAEGTLA